MSLKNKVLGFFWDGLLKSFSTGKLNLRSKIALWLVEKKIVTYFKEADKMEDKKWWASRTIWTNALLGIAGVITALTVDGGLNPKTVGVLTTVGGLINIVLRMVTEKPIEK